LRNKWVSGPRLGSPPAIAVVKSATPAVPPSTNKLCRISLSVNELTPFGIFAYQFAKCLRFAARVTLPKTREFPLFRSCISKSTGAAETVLPLEAGRLFSIDGQLADRMCVYANSVFSRPSKQCPQSGDRSRAGKPLGSDLRLVEEQDQPRCLPDSSL